MRKVKLRIGLPLDDAAISVWQCKMIENILQSDCAEIKLVIVNAPQKNQPNKTLTEKIKANRGHLLSITIDKLLNLPYHLLIERRHLVSDASEKRDSTCLLQDIPTLYCQPIQTKWSDRLEAPDIKAIDQDSKIIDTHTFSREGSLHVVDASYRRSRFCRKNQQLSELAPCCVKAQENGV